MIAVIPLYLMLKISVYTLVCMMAKTIIGMQVSNTWSFGFQWGLVRFLIGLAAGLLILATFAFTEGIVENVAISYFVAFGAIRYFEWLLLAKLISRKHDIDFGVRTQSWLLLGVLSSLFLDVLVYEFEILGNLKFVC